MKNIFAKFKRNKSPQPAAAAIAKQGVIVRNAEGDLVEEQQSYFKLTLSPDDAYDRLQPIAQTDYPEMLEEIKYDRKYNIKKAVFPWIEKKNQHDKDWDSIMGMITVKHGELILETNSPKRTERGKMLLTKYLGDAIKFVKTE